MKLNLLAFVSDTEQIRDRAVQEQPQSTYRKYEGMSLAQPRTASIFNDISNY